MRRAEFSPLAIVFVFQAAVLSCTGSVGNDGPQGGSGEQHPTPMPGGGPAPVRSDGTIVSDPGPSSHLLRLSHWQWENTVRDLLRLSQPTGLSQQFLVEPQRSMFDNSGGVLEVSSQLWVDYRRAAEQLAKTVARDANQLALLMPTGAPTDADGKARAFITTLGRRAYRRPLTDAEVASYVALFKQGPTLIASADPFADGVELVVTVMLQSPLFLYRTEFGGTPAGAKVPLTDDEIAARLSYGLTGSMPDEPLFAAADARRLHTPAGVLSEAKRLLDSPGGHQVVQNLHEQLGRETDPSELVRDPAANPLFKPGMGLDMVEERRRFVDDVIFARAAGLSELFLGRHTFVDDKLAPIYGVTMPPGVPSGTFAPVDLDPSQRGGLFTLSGFLAQTALDRGPQPIRRGVQLNRHVLCVDVPPPPPNVNTMIPPTLTAATNRQLYEQLTAAPECQTCHGQFLNPLGFAFENYDNLGRHRTMDGNTPVNATATYGFTEGQVTFTGALDLMRDIVGRQQAHDCYAQQLFAYLNGRDLVPDAPGDAALVAEIGRRSRQSASVKSLMLDLVVTDAFLTRQP